MVAFAQTKVSDVVADAATDEKGKYTITLINVSVYFLLHFHFNFIPFHKMYITLHYITVFNGLLKPEAKGSENGIMGRLVGRS